MLCRVVMLADDPTTSVTLEQIFSGPPKGEERAFLDDKANGRATGLWKELVEEYFNVPNWRPTNIFTDNRVSHLDPSKAPQQPWGPDQLRLQFSKMRTQFTLLNANFHKSGQMEEGADHAEGDDEFFEKYAGRDCVYLFMRMLFRTGMPSFISRDMVKSNQMDQGLGTQTTTPDSGGKRKQNASVTNEGLVKAMQIVSDDQSDFYKAQARLAIERAEIANKKHRIDTLQMQLKTIKENESLIGDEDAEMKRILTARRNQIILEIIDSKVI